MIYGFLNILLVMDLLDLIMGNDAVLIGVGIFLAIVGLSVDLKKRKKMKEKMFYNYSESDALQLLIAYDKRQLMINVFALAIPYILLLIVGINFSESKVPILSIIIGIYCIGATFVFNAKRGEGILTRLWHMPTYGYFVTVETAYGTKTDYTTIFDMSSGPSNPILVIIWLIVGTFLFILKYGLLCIYGFLAFLANAFLSIILYPLIYIITIAKNKARLKREYGI